MKKLGQESPQRLKGDIKFDGAMIASEDLVMDQGVLKLAFEPFADHEIVNPPTGIAGSCVETIAPPRILDFLRIKITEGIDETMT